MSYPDSQPPSSQSQPLFQSCNSPMPLQTPYQSDNDVNGVWPHFSINSNGQFGPHSQFEQHQPPHKRPRYDNDQLMNSRTFPPNNLPVNKGTTNIFFKTRICAKFMVGNCRNGEYCNFAHGEQDKRQPPPNWQDLIGLSARGEDDKPMGNWDDDQKIIHRMKLCKKFYNEEVCPYGDRCNFLHENPGKFRDDVGSSRESAAISISTTEQPMGKGSCGFNATEVNRPFINNAANMKPMYWKTRLCTKWETTGQCPFGDKCYFAHGTVELQISGGCAEGEVRPPPSVMAHNVSPTKTMSVPSLNEEGQGNKCLLKFKGPKKINRIYGDWLDDLPLVHSLRDKVES